MNSVPERREHLHKEVRQERILSIVEQWPGATPSFIAAKLHMTRSTYLIKLCRELCNEHRLLCLVESWHNGKPKFRFVLPEHQPRLL